VFLRTDRILYLIKRDDVFVLAFIEGHQQLPDDLDPDAT
jgi:hypothetical protein